MLKIGVTGGIGSGKSECLKHFKTLGIPVYDSDARAKYIQDNNQEIKNITIKHFGIDSYTETGMNRKFMASILFNNKDKMEFYNSIIKPFIKKDFEDWCNIQNSPYIVKESAILFESGGNIGLDKVICVFAPLEIRIKRILKRDPHRSIEDINSIIDMQLSDDEKIKLSNYVIINDNIQDLHTQIIEIDKIILKQIHIS